MKARPILFSGAMVRALLAGTKTQTRRIVKPQPDWLPEVQRTCVDGPFVWPIGGLGQQCGAPLTKLPYGVPGDLLVVRETWACHYATNDQRPRDIDRSIWSVRYAADGHIRPAASDGSCGLPEQFTKTRVSIHMPRWASRLTLEITDDRVERLQDISEADAKAEGITFDKGLGMFRVPGTHDYCMTAAAAYQRLWTLINGEESQAANPWTWAISFEVHQQNVDIFLREREAA